MPARLTRGRGGAALLRAMLESGQTIVAPGAFDPLSARLVEEAGFGAVYMTGFGTSAALIGRPDVGLLTMTEMVGNAGRIAACVDIPVIADADTGYGNPLNVIRTVGAYEAAGVAGIHIEDQVAPKKCGHMDGKLVIPAGEMVAKVRAAAEARSQPEFVIIARTDAPAVEGLDGAIERGRMYREAGADVLFIEAVVSEPEAAEVARAFPGVPLLFNWAEGGKTPPIGLDRLRELGYQIVIFPISTLLAATSGMRESDVRRRLDARLRAADRPAGAHRDPDDRAAASPGPPLRFGKSYAEIARLSSDIRAFLAVGEGLRALGYSTPRVYAHSVADGLALIEDFGTETIVDANGVNPSRYAEAAALLADLHMRPLPRELIFGGETYSFPVYDLDAMLIEVELALDWYAPAIARGAPSSGARMQFLGLWREILSAAARRAADLDAARLSFAQHPLARRAQRPRPARAHRFPGRGAGAAGL